MIAAMKNVLSPISDTMMTEKLAINACMNPKDDIVCGSAVVMVSSIVFWTGLSSSSSSSFGAKSQKTNEICDIKTMPNKAVVRNLLVALFAIF